MSAAPPSMSAPPAYIPAPYSADLARCLRTLELADAAGLLVLRPTVRSKCAMMLMMMMTTTTTMVAIR
eukprot:2988368-Rhodomonas_salina.1